MKVEEANKALVREAFEQVWNLRHVDRIPEFYSPEFVAEYPQFGSPHRGHDGLREWIEGIWSSSPEYHEELHELVAEGDLVVARLTISGIRRVQWGELPPTKLGSAEEILILRIRQDKIVWQHGVLDVLDVLRGLSLIPASS